MKTSTIFFVAAFLSLCMLRPVYGQVDDVLKEVKITPPKPPALSNEQLAGEYFRSREFEKAAVLYKELWEKNTSPVYYSFYLVCLVELKELKEAEKLVKKQIKTFPTSPKYLVDLGYIYSSDGETNKARKQFDEALKKIIPDRNQIMELSNTFLHRGETDYAVQAYLKGRQVMRDYPFHLELGSLYYQLGNWGGMIAEYLSELEYDPYNAQTVQNRLQYTLDNDEDGTIHELLRKNLLVRIHNQPQQTIFSEMLMWLSIQEKDFAMAFVQARSLDKRLSEEGHRVYELAQLSASNQNYDIAIEAYEYVLKKGKKNRLYIAAKIGLLNTKYEKTTRTPNAKHEGLIDLENEYAAALSDFGRSAVTIPLMRFQAHLQAFYLNKTEEAITLLEEAIRLSRPKDLAHAECKIELADILLFTGDVWEATLLYSQVEKAFKNEPIGHDAKLKNAKLSFYIGEFTWAKAQLDILKAATSKLIANDALELSLMISDNMEFDTTTAALEAYAMADLLSFRNQDEAALKTLDSLLAAFQWHPVLDEALLKKAEIQSKLGRFDDAARSLEDIIDRFPDDIKADDALFMLADIYERRFNDKDKAMELYLKLMTDYKASVFLSQARSRYRLLRGEHALEEVAPHTFEYYDVY